MSGYVDKINHNLDTVGHQSDRDTDFCCME